MASLSLVIPFYNERDLIEPAVIGCVEALQAQFADYELILVDDGSTDGSSEVLEGLKKAYPQLKVLRNEINLNVGIALQRGLCAATKDFVVHSGIDMPLAVGDLKNLVERAQDCDVLVLERDSFPGYTPWRWICSQLNRMLLKLLFGPEFTDLNFTQVYRRETLPGILPVAKSPAFTTPEMIFRARAKHLRVHSVRTRYLPRPRGKGAFGKPHDILWSLYDMVRFRFAS